MKFAKWYLCEIDKDGSYRLRAYDNEFVGKFFYKFSNARCKIFIYNNTEIIRNMVRNNE